MEGVEPTLPRILNAWNIRHLVVTRYVSRQTTAEIWSLARQDSAGVEASIARQVLAAFSLLNRLF